MNSARLARPEVDLTVSEFADRYRIVSRIWVAVSRSLADRSRAYISSRAYRLPSPRSSRAAGDAKILGANWEDGGRRQLVLFHCRSRTGANVKRAADWRWSRIKYNRVKLQPTIDGIATDLKQRVRPEKLSRRSRITTTAFKRFSGGFNQIVTASSSKGLQMISVRWLVLDEISGFPRDVDGRGSPSSQARSRQKAFGDSGEGAVDLDTGNGGRMRDFRPVRRFRPTPFLYPVPALRRLWPLEI